MEPTRYIVRAREGGSTLGDFLAAIEGDPDLTLIDTIGPPEQPHTAVVAVAPEQAPCFENRFRNSPHLLIEQDRPLSLFPTAEVSLQQSERNTHA